MDNPILVHQTLRIPRHVPRHWLASVLALLVASPAAHAALVLDLPDLMLQPNQASQTFTITVQNTGDTGVQVNGVQLELIIGNGDVAIGGSGEGPAFQAVTVVATSNLLFYPNNTGDRGAGNFATNFPPDGLKQLFQRLTSTSSGTVTLAPNSPSDLATVTFDTTGVQPGVYSWSATNSPNGISFFTDTSGQVFPTCIDGLLTVVPEPVNVALPIFGGLAVLACGLRRWCRRKTSGC
jgi:hypothetical protein